MCAMNTITPVSVFAAVAATVVAAVAAASTAVDRKPHAGCAHAPSQSDENACTALAGDDVQGNNKKPDAGKLQELLKPTVAGMEKIESLKDRRSKTVKPSVVFHSTSCACV